MTKRPKKQTAQRALTIDEQRFAIWEQIRELQLLGYEPHEIATSVQQPVDAVTTIIESKALNRIRLISISGSPTA